MKMSKNSLIAIGLFVFTVGLLCAGYFSFGLLTTIVFTSGFLGGYILWLLAPNDVSFKTIKIPYWLTLIFFVAHRVEENLMKFQERLSDITGNPVPEITSPALIFLVISSVGGWLLIPVLLKRKYAIGYYLAWTFFASMGITELAHFVFPLLTTQQYGYFPGMATVVVLAPTAWWGMKKLLEVSDNKLQA